MRRQRIDALPKKFGGKVGVERMVRVVLEENHAGLAGRRLALYAWSWSRLDGGRRPADGTRYLQRAASSTLRRLRNAGSQPGSVSGSAAPVRGHPAGSARACPRHRDAAAQPCVLPARRGRLRRAITSGCAKSSAAVALTRFQSRHSRMLMITLCFGGIADRAEGDLARIGHAVSTPARPTKYKKRG
jgi:hypothetical protein